MFFLLLRIGGIQMNNNNNVQVRNTRLYLLVEIAIFAAVAFALDLLIPKLGWSFRIGFDMVPIMILALRWGIPAGMAGGLIWGLLQIVSGDAYVLTVAQVILEYPIACMSLALAGIFFVAIQKELRKSNYTVGKAIAYAVGGALIGSVGRFVCHWLAGVIFWGSGAAPGQSVYLFSLAVNGPAMITDMIATSIIMVILAPFYQKIIRNPRVDYKF